MVLCTSFSVWEHDSQYISSYFQFIIYNIWGLAFICLTHNTTAFLEISLNLLDGIWCVNVIKMKFFLNEWPCSYVWGKIFMSSLPNTVSVETVYIIKCTCGMFISFTWQQTVTRPKRNVNSCLCIQILLLKIQALNIPVDACYIKTECKSLVVQVLRCWCINHAKHRAAALTEEICDQAAAGNISRHMSRVEPKSDSKVLHIQSDKLQSSADRIRW